MSVHIRKQRDIDAFHIRNKVLPCQNACAVGEFGGLDHFQPLPQLLDHAGVISFMTGDLCFQKQRDQRRFFDLGKEFLRFFQIAGNVGMIRTNVGIFHFVSGGKVAEPFRIAIQNRHGFAADRIFHQCFVLDRSQAVDKAPRQEIPACLPVFGIILQCFEGSADHFHRISAELDFRVIRCPRQTGGIRKTCPGGIPAVRVMGMQVQLTIISQHIMDPDRPVMAFFRRQLQQFHPGGRRR